MDTNVLSPITADSTILEQSRNHIATATQAGVAIGAGWAKSWIDGFSRVRSVVKPGYCPVGIAHTGSASIPVVKYAGNTYLVGDVERIGESGHALGDGFKSEYFKLMALTVLALQSKPGMTSYNVTLSVPDQATANEAFQLEGIHDLTVNGKQYTLNIRNVQVVAEGIGSSVALNGGLVVDWGHQNTTVSQLSSDGTLIHDFIESGVLTLIRQIAKTTSQGKKASDRAIIQGLESGALKFNGGGDSFATAYNELFPIWCNQALTDIAHKFPELFNTGEVVYFVGGGSQLPNMADVAQMFGAQIVENPQALEVRGLASFQ